MDMEALQQPARLKITNVFKGPLRRVPPRRADLEAVRDPALGQAGAAHQQRFAIGDRAWRASSRQQFLRFPVGQCHRFGGAATGSSRRAYPGPGAAPARSRSSASAVSRSTRSAELAVVVPERTRAGGTTASGAGSQTVFCGPRSRQLSLSASLSFSLSRDRSKGFHDRLPSCNRRRAVWPEH
jgi:hypothetical protein